MESPTTEISVGMEALRLGIVDNGLVEATNTKTNVCTVTTRVDGRNVNNLPSFESLRGTVTSTSPTHFDLCSPAFPRTQPPTNDCKRFSVEANGQNGVTVFHIEPTTVRGDPCTCMGGVKQTGYCQVCSKLVVSTDSNDSGTRVVHSQSLPSGPDQDMVNSFNSLCVNGGNSQLSLNSSTLHRPRTCHQQQAEYDSYSSHCCFDDTTVDDLAGYFDELMHLPKPMSEMAELMYT